MKHHCGNISKRRPVDSPRMFFLGVVLLVVMSADIVRANLFATPPVVDTGVSNITTAFAITSDVAGITVWNATASGVGTPPWLALDVNAGTVTASGAVVVPMTVHRENINLPAPCTVTGTVTVTGGTMPRTVLVITTITPENCGIFLKIASTARAWAGVPHILDARGTIGWVQNYFWFTNWNMSMTIPQQSFALRPVDQVTFHTPMRRTLNLVAVDALGRLASTTKTIDVYNSRPWVDAGGPYTGMAGQVVHVTATGGDPNPNELLEYRWQADPPTGPWTPWSTNPSANITWYSTYKEIIVCEVRDTWPGTQVYNQPLVNSDVARVTVSNIPPTVLVQYFSNSTWTALARRQDVMLPAMHTNLVMRASATDGEAIPTPGPLTIEWREHPDNPQRGLISASARTNSAVTIDDFNKIGVYRFMVVAHDGELCSAVADFHVVVPGLDGHVFVDGFQNAISVWGTYPTAGYPGNTNAFGVHDLTQTRSDSDGVIPLDRAINAQNWLKLQRDEPKGTREKEYVFLTTIASSFNGHEIFYFPPTMHPYGGRIVNLNNLSQYVSTPQGTLITRGVRTPSDGNIQGHYNFGKLPVPWPYDNEQTGSYYVVFQKPNYTTYTLKLTPSKVQFEKIDELWGLTPTNGTITLSGTVLATESGLPVKNATIWFGQYSTTNLANGTFTMQLPVPTVHNVGDPTHVLVVEAPGYKMTQNVYTSTETGGTVNVYIDGGNTMVFGTICDSQRGCIVTNGSIFTVRLPTAPQDGRTNVWGGSLVVGGDGYFAFELPGGADAFAVEKEGVQVLCDVPHDLVGRQAYQLVVDMMASNAAFVDITNQDATVANTTTAALISGSNSIYTVGSLMWTNNLTGDWGSLPVGTPWWSFSVPLGVGTNTIWVYGTNSAGIVASDAVVIVRSAPIIGASFVDITNGNRTVDNQTTTCTIAGTNNVDTVGYLRWSNSFNGAAGSVPVSSFEFQVSNIPLAVGPNTIWVYGTNVLGSIASDSVTITRLGQVPDAPTDVAASDGAYTNKVGVTWTAASNALTYAVYRSSVNDTNGAATISGAVEATYFDDVAVVPGQVYYYWVRAGNSNGWSGFSAGNSGYAQTSTEPVPVVQPLFLDFSTNHTARNITVVNIGSGSFTFVGTVTTGSQWLAVSPQAGAVSNQAVSLVASVNRASMADNTYMGLIAVTPSVGVAVVVTCRMDVAGNSVVARPGGPYMADQGSPVTLDASGSAGAGLQYRWEVGDFISPYSTANVRYAYTGYVPGTNDVLLTIKDNRVPAVYDSVNTVLAIRNVAPITDIGGPYTGTVNRVVSLNAVVRDPGTSDVLNIRWDFGDGGGWQSWYGLIATNMTHIYLAGGSYVVQCQVRDNYGAESAVDVAGVFIDTPNMPPTARATLGSPGVVLSNFVSMRMGFVLDGSGSVDDRAAATNLYFDWREDVHNPAKPLLTDAQRHQTAVTNSITFPLPGVYKYHLVVNDGEYNSAPATVQINVPGVRGMVKAEGIMALLPVWGVMVVATNAATGAADWCLSDTEGKFVLDTGVGSSRMLVLSRGDQEAVRNVHVDADGVTYPEPDAVLAFSARACGLSVIVHTGYVGGAWLGLPGASGRIVVGDTVAYNGDSDLQGQMAFGGIPELYPRTATVNYQVLYQKSGYASQVVSLQAVPTTVAQHTPQLDPSGGCIVQGTVLGTNNMPAGGIEVDFGPAFTPVVSAQDGTFAVSNLMRGTYFAELSGDDYDTTYETVLVPQGSPTYTLPQPLCIRGGRFSVYGEIFNVENGMPVHGATVTVVETSVRKTYSKMATTNAAGTTRTGYFDLPVVKGNRVIEFSAPGYDPTTIVVNARNHVQQPVQLTPIPEPGLLGVLAFLAVLGRRRMNIELG